MTAIDKKIAELTVARDLYCKSGLSWSYIDSQINMLQELKPLIEQEKEEVYSRGYDNGLIDGHTEGKEKFREAGNEVSTMPISDRNYMSLTYSPEQFKEKVLEILRDKHNSSW